MKKDIMIGALVIGAFSAALFGSLLAASAAHDQKKEIASREESMRKLAGDLAQLQLALCEEMGGIVTYTVIPGYDTAQARCEARVVTP